MHPDGLAPALAANGPLIREWYWRARRKLDLHARGFTVSQVRGSGGQGRSWTCMHAASPSAR